MSKDKLKEYAPALLRIGISIVFLWFGITQLLEPSAWTGYIPEFLTGTGIPLTTFVTINGLAEIILAAMLITGLYVRIASLLLGIHLLAITISVGYNPTGIRDLGLSLATLAISLNGPDRWCIMKK